MSEALVFPRLIYRGAPDHLGLGDHVDPETDERVGETKRVDSQAELDAAIDDGWRLTRELEDGADAGAGGADAAAAKKAAAAAKKAAAKK